jgi:hypothetical protein
MAERIWSGTRALAQQHLDSGQRVWLVTATPVELAAIIARRLGLTGALGTVAEVVDGRYTGRLVGDMLHGPAKAEAIRSLADREGLDLARCTAYSDSVNDVPMLSLVGRAVAVNPDPDLKKHAREQEWEIRDYRVARKAARIGVPAAAGLGAVTGGVVAGVAFRRRHHGHGHVRQAWDAVSELGGRSIAIGAAALPAMPRPQPAHRSNGTVASLRSSVSRIPAPSSVRLPQRPPPKSRWSVLPH